MTKLRSEPETAFLLKYLIIGVICSGFGIWATYDCFVKYPNMIPRAEEWEKLLKDKTLDDAAKDQRYKDIAKERNWPVKHPSKDESVESIKANIKWQYIFMAIGYGIGLPLVVWYLRSRNAWIELDGQTITSSWGQQLNFKEIVNFDKKRWDKKGIGVVHYQQAGQSKKFVIDDLKFNRRITDEMVRIMESQIQRQQIVNGEPEKALEKPAASESDAG